MKIASFLSFVKMRLPLKKGTCQISSVVVMNRLTKLKEQKTVSSLFVISRCILRLGFWIVFVTTRISLYRGSFINRGSTVIETKFLTICRKFPTIFRRFSECCSKVIRTFTNISELFQHLPKSSEENRDVIDAIKRTIIVEL